MVAERVNRIAPSRTVELTARIDQMRRQGETIISLNVGEPDVTTPEHICQAAEQAMREGFMRYTPVMGILPLREAICRKLKRENGAVYEPSEITIGAGAKQCIYAALLALCSPGDEVIIPYPCWVSYTELVKMAEGVPVPVPCREDFGLDLEAIRKAVTPRTKAIIINTPNNPTGAVYDREMLRELGELAVRHDFYILSDEVYEALVYDGKKHVSMVSFSEEIRKKVILVNGFSKTYAMTGWRLGYLAAPVEVIRAVNVMQSQMISCVHALSQKAAIAALEGTQEPVRRMVEMYEKRRDFLWEKLQGIDGISCRKSAGAFYLLVDVTAWIGAECDGEILEDDVALAEYLLREAHVALVPGSAFLAPGHLRITYTADLPVLDDAARAIENALRKLKR